VKRGRCQICGRMKPRRADGGIVHHHVRGVPCPGKGALPLEEDDRFLESEARRHRAAERSIRATIRDLVARRVNYIDPALERAADDAWRTGYALERRLARHRAWPDRYERQMARDGMAMPPPAYLLERRRRGEA